MEKQHQELSHFVVIATVSSIALQKTLYMNSHTTHFVESVKWFRDWNLSQFSWNAFLMHTNRVSIWFWGSEEVSFFFTFNPFLNSLSTTADTNYSIPQSTFENNNNHRSYHWHYQITWINSLILHDLHCLTFHGFPINKCCTI